MSQVCNLAQAHKQATIPADARSLPIDSIIVGERHRRDLGDIDGLAASIAELGLLQPIVVRSDGTLIAGARRLCAAQQLGWTEIPVNVVDLAAVRRGELAENRHRKDFTPSELVAIGAELEHEERELAKEREREGGRCKGSGKLPDPDKGSTRDKVAAHLRISGRTYEKAKAVVEAATAEPAKYSYLVEAMDRTGRVDSAYRQLKSRQQDEAGHAKPPRSKPNEQWVDLRAAFEHLTSLPCPHDAAHAVAKLAKVGEIIDRKLPGTVEWLLKFQAEWNSMRDISLENGAEPTKAKDSVGEFKQLRARIEELENENRRLKNQIGAPKSEYEIAAV
jgi:ParB-like chromosome segregation protein Spo0J